MEERIFTEEKWRSRMARNSATEYSFTCQGMTGISPWLFWGVEQMKLPPVDKPFSTKPVRDLNARNASLTQRFKQRFHLNRSGTQGMNADSGVVKTSR